MKKNSLPTFGNDSIRMLFKNIPFHIGDCSTVFALIEELPTGRRVLNLPPSLSTLGLLCPKGSFKGRYPNSISHVCSIDPERIGKKGLF